MAHLPVHAPTSATSAGQGSRQRLSRGTHHGATLEPVRFGEFLRDRAVITDEQWLAALALHWSSPGSRVGEAIVRQGFLSAGRVEDEARAFHDDLAVVEVGEAGEIVARSPLS